MSPEQFSAKFPIGTEVKYFPFANERNYERVRIRSEAWRLGHGQVVVKITGRAGGVCIEHIEKV